MRYARLVGPGRIDIEDGDDPTPQRGQVVVEIDTCGIGGSDREAYEIGTSASPAWFGHEWTGRVVAIGPGVVDRFEGQRVVAGVSPPCGACPPCRSSRPAYCRSTLEQTVGLDPLAADHGGFATHTVADARRLVPIAEAIDIRSAALIEPASVAVHAVRRSGLSIGDVTVVVGAGTVGLLTAEIARISGAAHVVSVDTAATRRELACDLGSDAAFAAVDDSLRSWLHAHTGGLGADVVFVCVDTVEAISGGIGLVGSGGSIVAVGVGDRIDNLSITSLLIREADFRVSLGYSADDIARVQALMQQDRLHVRQLIQTPDVRGLAEVVTAFAADQDHRPGPPKVLVRPNA